MRTNHSLQLVFCLGLLLASGPPITARAGIPGGVAIVVGFHVQPAEDTEALPLPPSPDCLRPRAADPGLYDVWVFLHTRAPLIGAWTISLALDYNGRDGQGVDVLDWESFTDTLTPHPGWPAAGCGMFAGWWRGRCMDPHRYMLRGADGWWVQPVLKFRVRVHGPDRIGVTDPEPDVRPQIIECADEEHDLDGTDSWSRVVPAVFGPEEAGTAADNEPVLPAIGVTWGAVKSRHGSRP